MIRGKSTHRLLGFASGNVVLNRLAERISGWNRDILKRWNNACLVDQEVLAILFVYDPIQELLRGFLLFRRTLLFVYNDPLGNSR
ncbi:hypothetical protein D3C77_576140 [compost metagenome]